MRRIACISLVALSACAAPSGNVAVSPDGQAAGTVSTGNVTVGAGPSGAAASAKVVDTPTTDVTVGTNGASVAVRPTGLPVSVGVGTGGIRVGF